MQPTVYRQRFSVIGWIGAVFFVAGPPLAGWQFAEVLTAQYGAPPLGPLFLFSIMPALGVVMMLIGREYYDATDKAAKEAADIKAYYEKQASSSAASPPSRS